MKNEDGRRKAAIFVCAKVIQRELRAPERSAYFMLPPHTKVATLRGGSA